MPPRSQMEIFFEVGKKFYDGSPRSGPYPAKKIRFFPPSFPPFPSPAMAFWGAWTPPQVVRCAAARPASPPYLYYAGGVYLFSLATQRFAKMVRKRRQRAKLGGGGAESSALASAARSIASRHWDFGFWERAAAGTVLGRSMLSNTAEKMVLCSTGARGRRRTRRQGVRGVRVCCYCRVLRRSREGERSR